ncbi:MAG TPA: glycerophosphodiester phosphodiesterase, partial [Delftia acidovorans]|nr:glycerophosphodiester phosphodiesterase [Delftia acidovorans]
MPVSWVARTIDGLRTRKADMNRFPRRRALALAGVAAGLLLAGCATPQAA